MQSETTAAPRRKWTSTTTKNAALLLVGAGLTVFSLRLIDDSQFRLKAQLRSDTTRASLRTDIDLASEALKKAQKQLEIGQTEKAMVTAKTATNDLSDRIDEINTCPPNRLSMAGYGVMLISGFFALIASIKGFSREHRNQFSQKRDEKT
jgi:hypothetical protein